MNEYIVTEKQLDSLVETEARFGRSEIVDSIKNSQSPTKREPAQKTRTKKKKEQSVASSFRGAFKDVVGKKK